MNRIETNFSPTATEATGLIVPNANARGLAAGRDAASESAPLEFSEGAVPCGTEAVGRSASPMAPRPLRAANAPGGATDDDWREARARALLCDEFIRLTEVEHFSLVGAAKRLGKSPSLFSGPNSMLARYLGGGAVALLPCRPATSVNVGELTEQIESLGWFIPAARWFYLNTNRTNNSGSVPEAVRRTISLPNLPIGWSRAIQQKFLRAIGGELPTCPVELREAILARQAAGQPLVPERIARQITVNPVTVRQKRHATNAALDYLSAPGSLFFITDKTTGERRPPLAGEVIEADDATINFPVCVPWTLGGDPCSEKFGVKVGRFQWLVCVDAASRFVTAWTYVMRPRSSYRAEDALALMRAHCLQHGIPGQWRFEQGVWKSNLVKHAIAGIGSDLHTVWSPHQKPYIEGLFNTLWTKLSIHFPDADVGRFRGETEEASLLLTACQRGQRDPRRHFPMLNTALAAFGEVITEKQSTPVNSDIGRWIPAERWAGKLPGANAAAAANVFVARPLDAETEWLFSPYVREWTVKGMLVGGRVPLFEDLSVPFDFAADWLPQYHGARVRCHFNPMAGNCSGMLVLAEDFQNRKAGTVLGLAKQINEVAGYARLVLGWGDDNANEGRLLRQRAAAAMRREVRAVDGKSAGYSHSEERDGVAMVTTLERGGARESTAEPAEASRVVTNAATEILPVDRTARLREIEELERQNAHLFG